MASTAPRLQGVVWIDLENSPHVPFFQPLIRWLEERGVEVLLTARNLSQTEELLALAGLPFESIGGHAAGSRTGRAFRSARRGLQLARWAHGKKIDLAVGHGSRGQALAAWLLRIPSISFFDYEHVSLGAYRFCSRILVPEFVAIEDLVRKGLPRKKLVSYPGYKEQVYLDPASDHWRPADPPIILVRPPAVRAHYHTELSDRCYARLLDRLADEAAHCRVLILPRYDTDANDLSPWLARAPHFEVLSNVNVGRDLLVQASMVASGGGTMVREAAVLGVPAVSFFGGPMGAVDLSLVEAGRLKMVRSEADVDSIRFPGAAPSEEDGHADSHADGHANGAPHGSGNGVHYRNGAAGLQGNGVAHVNGVAAVRVNGVGGHVNGGSVHLNGAADSPRHGVSASRANGGSTLHGHGVPGPHGNGGSAPHGNGVSGSHGNGGSAPHGNGVSGPHGNGGSAPHGNGVSGPHGNGGSAPHGNGAAGSEGGPWGHGTQLAPLPSTARLRSFVRSEVAAWLRPVDPDPDAK